MKEVDLTETLLVVTADHSHVLTLGGLTTHRGNPIFGEPDIHIHIHICAVCTLSLTRYILRRARNECYTLGLNRVDAPTTE